MQVASSARWFVACIGVVLLISPSARSFEIWVDPGEVGEQFADPLGLSLYPNWVASATHSLAGTPLDGQRITIDVRFTDDKYLSWEPLDPLVIGNNFFFNLNFESALAQFDSDDNSGALFDQFGQHLPLGGDPTIYGGGLFELEFVSNDFPANLPFFGAHYEVDLPNLPGEVITESDTVLVSAVLYTVDPGNLGGRYFVVGQVPEPSSIALALVGATALLGYRWRRNRRG